ncbi:MAG TPA: holo-ACP synthase [Blastocatellia bacterium]|nr:holo-ACP synthase [Blastocatellia bacterium]
MVIGVGIDLIEISRIADVLKRRGVRFRDRVFTIGEIEYCESVGSKHASYAARFAAKEAAMKALGRGWFDGISWTDIETLRTDPGPPRLQLSGVALERFGKLGGKRVHLSLSHSRDLAIAQVVIEG